MDVCQIPEKKLQWPEKDSTVAVGLSGGVDSAVTALLLKERGCKVIGVTMSSWNNDVALPPSKNGVRMSCYSSDESIDISQCVEFCKAYGIKHYVIDVRTAYKTFVLEYFKKEYRAGRTPNPCVHCNAHVKFAALLEKSRALGVRFDYFCTGHYASLVRPEISMAEIYCLCSKNGAVRQNCASVSGKTHPVMVSAAKDTLKDQTYFLHRVPSKILEYTRFPLSCFTKKQIFELARERGLKSASRAESQDFICPEYFDIVFSDKKSVRGDIVDLNGVKLGEHRGIEHYTIGQRRGLGVSANRPLYVQYIDSEKNRIVLADESALLSTAFQADSWVWAGNYVPQCEFNAMVKIRLATPAFPARIVPEKSGIYNIFFEKPQRAIAPGQSAVVYLNGLILGGGIISRTIIDVKTNIF